MKLYDNVYFFSEQIYDSKFISNVEKEALILFFTIYIWGLPVWPEAPTFFNHAASIMYHKNMIL